MALNEDHEKPLCLLSLDGGGVRGLSSIIILKHLMTNISRQQGRQVKPWELFDMIGGTSTGGLIAIMLGRLRMSLEECEDAYLDLSQRIFKPRRSKWRKLSRGRDFLMANGRFDHRILEEAIKEIVSKRSRMDESALLQDKDDTDPKCKVFVCAARTGNSQPAILRSYETSELELLKDCKIWEACRATSAATTFFDPIKIGKHGQEFADGAIIYNNPIQLVEREASNRWPSRIGNAIILSIGTGSAPGAAFKGSIKDVIEAMKSIVTQTEKTANDFDLAHESMYKEGRLFRFNVYHGLSDVGLEEWKEREKIANSTQTYLENAEVRRQTNECIKVFSGRDLSTENTKFQIAPAANPRLLRRKSLNRDLHDCIQTLRFENMDSREANIELAHRNTCDWLFQTTEFILWKSQKQLQRHNGVLWIKGHPGVGKSTLMKHALIHCQNNFKKHIVAFYGFNARGVRSLERSPVGMLRSIMIQFLEKESSLQESVLQSFTRKKTRGDYLWEYGELKTHFLLEYKSRSHEQRIILIDALDECNHSEVEDVVAFLETLSHSASESGSKLMICLSSRHYPTIDMEKKIELVVEGQVGHDQDIADYVGHKLKSKRQDIQEELLLKARHIFIWVVLVVEILNREFLRGSRAIREKLDDLPADLDQLFSKIVDVERSSSDNQATLLLLLWVLFSKETLTSENLYKAVLTGTTPNEIGDSPDGSPTDFETIKLFINYTSMGLVEIVRNKSAQNVVQFIHQSVVEFFTRNQRLLKLDPCLGPSVIGESHNRLALCCLAYIQQSTTPSRTEMQSQGRRAGPAWDFDMCPFLNYACENLLLHAENAQAEGISQLNLLHALRNQSNGVECIKLWLSQAFRGQKFYKRFELIHLLCWWGHTELFRVYLEKFSDSSDGELQRRRTVLEMAVGEDRIDIVILLLDNNVDINYRGKGKYCSALQTAIAEGFEDIAWLLLCRKVNPNIQGGKYGSALQAAAAKGNEDMVALILKKKADPNIQGGKYGSALQAAAANGYYTIVALLLQKEADPNIQGGKYGSSVAAAFAKGRTDIVTVLLDNGLHPIIDSSEYGHKWLQVAVFEARPEIVALLLEKEVNPNIQGRACGTLLHDAVFQSNDRILELLLQKHADTTLRMSLSISPFQAALHCSLFWAVQAKLKDEVASLLKYERVVHPDEDEVFATRVRRVMDAFRVRGHSDRSWSIYEGTKSVINLLVRYHAKREPLDLETYMETAPKILKDLSSKHTEVGETGLPLWV